MKKILVLTPRFPYPVIGGDRLRIYQICKELAKHYELHLVSLCEYESELGLKIPADDVFKSVDRVLLPKWRSYLNCVLALPTGKALQVAYYSSRKFQQIVNEKIKECDYALAHLVRTAKYLENCKIPKVLEMTDAISMNYERVADTAKNSGFKNLVYSTEQSRLQKYEIQMIASFNKSVLVSQIDKDFLLNDSNKDYEKVLVCTNGVDTESLKYSFCETSKQIVFIGNLYSVQNLDAALWFSKEVMPLLRTNGNFTFKVIGRIKDRDKQKFADYDGVELTGSVDSVAAEAEQSLAGVCSVRLAAGVQNKILEYMALGIPCVSSSIGLEGLAAKPDSDLLIADKPEDYVKSILKLHDDKFFSAQVALNGREYVERQHSWSSKLSTFVDVFNKFEN